MDGALAEDVLEQRAAAGAVDHHILQPRLRLADADPCLRREHIADRGAGVEHALDPLQLGDRGPPVPVRIERVPECRLLDHQARLVDATGGVLGTHRVEGETGEARAPACGNLRRLEQRGLGDATLVDEHRAGTGPGDVVVLADEAPPVGVADVENGAHRESAPDPPAWLPKADQGSAQGEWRESRRRSGTSVVNPTAEARRVAVPTSAPGRPGPALRP